MQIVFIATFGGARTLADGTVKITLDLQETNAKTVGKIFQLQRKTIKGLLSTENISEEQALEIDKLIIKEQGRKSQSERIRNSLYRLWEQVPEGFDEFDPYYRKKTEQYITLIQSAIPNPSQ